MAHSARGTSHWVAPSTSRGVPTFPRHTDVGCSRKPLLAQLDASVLSDLLRNVRAQVSIRPRRRTDQLRILVWRAADPSLRGAFLSDQQATDRRPIELWNRIYYPSGSVLTCTGWCRSWRFFRVRAGERIAQCGSDQKSRLVATSETSSSGTRSGSRSAPIIRVFSQPSVRGSACETTSTAKTKKSGWFWS